METYELTYIISGQLSPTEADFLAKEIETFIQSKEGIIIAAHNPSARPLAYRIKKQASGYFATLVLQILENNLKEVHEYITKHAQVLRSMTLIKKPFKVAKERRTRKALPRESVASSFLASAAKKAEGPINETDLNKKLDEILGE